MKLCLNCGKGISDEQADSYMGFCETCLQTEVQQKIKTEAANRGVPLCQMGSCSNIAVVKCGNCGKSVCASHAMANSSGTIVRCQTCGQQRNNGRVAWRVIRIIISVVILVGIIIGIF